MPMSPKSMAPRLTFLWLLFTRTDVSSLGPFGVGSLRRAVLGIGLRDHPTRKGASNGVPDGTV